MRSLWAYTSIVILLICVNNHAQAQSCTQPIATYCQAAYEVFGFPQACDGPEVCYFGTPTDYGPCVPQRCGDGLVGPDEVCDDGADNGSGICNATCTGFVAVCGNGTIEDGEACDVGPIGSATDGCTPTCQCDPDNPQISVDTDSKTWTVTTNGNNDSYAIQCAMAATQGDPDATVHLVGTLIARNGIRAVGFDGVLTGDGQDSTVIVASGLGTSETMNSVFHFDGVGGTAGASVSNLSVHVPAEGRFQSLSRSATGDFTGSTFYFKENSGASVRHVAITADNPNFRSLGRPDRPVDRAIVSDSCYDSFDIVGATMSQIIRTVYSVTTTAVPSDRRCAFSLLDTTMADVRNTFYFLGETGASCQSSNTDFLVAGNAFARTGGAWLPMFGDGTVVVIDNDFIDTVGNADVWAEGLGNTSLFADNRHVRPAVFGGVYWISQVANLTVTNNAFEDLQESDPGRMSRAIYLEGSSDTLLLRNIYTFSGVESGYSYRDDYDPDDYFENPDFPFNVFDVQPLIFIDGRRGFTDGNVVQENKFPPLPGVSLCQFIAQTRSDATIHHAQSCN